MSHHANPEAGFSKNLSGDVARIVGQDREAAVALKSRLAAAEP